MDKKLFMGFKQVPPCQSHRVNSMTPGTNLPVHYTHILIALQRETKTKENAKDLVLKLLCRTSLH